MGGSRLPAIMTLPFVAGGNAQALKDIIEPLLQHVEQRKQNPL